MDGSTWDQAVMYKLGQIESKIDGLTAKLEEHTTKTNERFKPVEKTTNRLGWLMGVAAGFGATVLFIIEKIGSKWLNLF